jgi:hypothetical protein
MEEFEEKFIKPIINASYPATLAALNLTVLQVSALSGEATPVSLKVTFLLGSAAFLLAAFCVFFYSLYPTRRVLWTITAINYLVGLVCSVISVLLLFVF